MFIKTRLRFRFSRSRYANLNRPETTENQNNIIAASVIKYFHVAGYGRVLHVYDAYNARCTGSTRAVQYRGDLYRGYYTTAFVRVLWSTFSKKIIQFFYTHVVYHNVPIDPGVSLLFLLRVRIDSHVNSLATHAAQNTSFIAYEYRVYSREFPPPPSPRKYSFPTIFIVFFG